ncbi:hypothetical protein Bca4012_102881 [Brassica carinata]
MTIRQYAYQHAGPSRGLSVEIFATRTVRGDFRHEDCPPARISARWPFPWTIRGDFRHEDCPRDCPRVIFATRTVRQDAYQHAGPSRGLSGDFRHEDCPPVRISARWPFPWTIRGDFRHEDCPRVIFATWTIRGTDRQYEYQHGGPSRGISLGHFRPRGLSVGDFRPRGLSVVIFATRTVRQYAYQHAGPSRGLSAVIFGHDECPWVIFAYEDCPWVIFAHEDCPSVRITARSPFPWTVRVLFAHEDSTSVHISARWPFPWTVRVIFAHEDCPSVDNWSAIGGGRCAASSPDSDLEALSHNPAHGSFATGFSTKRDDQLCESTVPLASDVPPSQTPHLTMSSARSTRRVLGLKEGVVTPPPIHGSDSPCPHFSSELAVRRPGKLPKSRSQSAPADTRRSARHVSAQAARQQSTGSNWDPEPSPQSQSFSGYGSILPTSLPTLFHRPEAVHLGDLMRYEYDRRERTRSSGFSRAGMHRHHATRRCSSSR